MNKYKNKKVTVDGIDFDSIKESVRYKQLKLLQRAGLIKDLKLQTKFELQPTFKKNNKIIRAITYKADFDYLTKDGKHIVEDVKGMETEVFKLKRKMFEYKFKDLEIKIVK